MHISKHHLILHNYLYVANMSWIYFQVHKETQSCMFSDLWLVSFVSTFQLHQCNIMCQQTISISSLTPMYIAYTHLVSARYFNACICMNFSKLYLVSFPFNINHHALSLHTFIQVPMDKTAKRCADVRVYVCVSMIVCCLSSFRSWYSSPITKCLCGVYNPYYFYLKLYLHFHLCIIEF